VLYFSILPLDIPKMKVFQSKFGIFREEKDIPTIFRQPKM